MLPAPARDITFLTCLTLSMYIDVIRYPRTGEKHINKNELFILIDETRYEKKHYKYICFIKGRAVKNNKINIVY